MCSVTVARETLQSYLMNKQESTGISRESRAVRPAQLEREGDRGVGAVVRVERKSTAKIVLRQRIYDLEAQTVTFLGVEAGRNPLTVIYHFHCNLWTLHVEMNLQ